MSKKQKLIDEIQSVIDRLNALTMKASSEGVTVTLATEEVQEIGRTASVRLMASYRLEMSPSWSFATASNPLPAREPVLMSERL